MLAHIITELLKPIMTQMLRGDIDKISFRRVQVYKSAILTQWHNSRTQVQQWSAVYYYRLRSRSGFQLWDSSASVSYTHLTLPTIYSV